MRSFTLSYNGNVKGGYVLLKLIEGRPENDLNLDVAKYYAMRGER